MPTSSRFAVAVHILTGLARHDGEPLTSEAIAKSADTNPAVIRRILSMLGAAGLSQSQLGKGGGSLLARPADEITLWDVYRAVETEQLFALHRGNPDHDCAVGRHIKPALQKTIDRALGAMEAELEQVTIEHVAADVREAERRRLRKDASTKRRGAARAPSPRSAPPRR